MIVLSHVIYLIIQHYHANIVRKFKMCTDEIISSEVTVQSEVKLDSDENKLEFVMRFDPPMYCQRYTAVHDILLNADWKGQIKKVVDFGCSEFGFFNYLKHITGLQEILFVDIDKALLEFNYTRVFPLQTDYLCRRKEPLNIKVLHGSVSNPDIRLMDVDAVICIEIIEHLYPDTLDALPFNIFGVIKPRIAIFTTPNSDFNVLFPNFSGFRHYDHKFEWSREQFQDWAQNITLRYPEYSVTYQGIGPGPQGTEKYGECSQMVVFVKLNKSTITEDSYKEFFCNNDISSQSEAKVDNNVDEYRICKFCKYAEINNYNFISYGVCTYINYSSKINCVDIVAYDESCGECVHRNLCYEEICTIDYPFEVDNRTQEEKILHNVQYTIYSLGGFNGQYFNDELDLAEIPLRVLAYNEEGGTIPLSDLSNILQAAGHQIEERNVDGYPTLCVIYQPYETMSKSSHRTRSTENTEIKEGCVSENWDEAPWDEETNQNENPTVTTEHSPEKNSENVEKENTEDKTDEIAETSGTTSPKRLECIFDSGCQVSSSSIEILTPEILRNIQAEKNASKPETDKAKSETGSLKSFKNPLKRQTVNSPALNLTVLKLDGDVKVPECNVGDVFQIEGANVPPAQAEIMEPPANIIENGDLANNNRDGEGNNYQAQENPVVEHENDNAVPRVLQEEEAQAGNNDDLELEEFNLENVSQEVLFDPNSENSLSEIDLVPGEQMQRYPPFYNALRVGRMPVNIVSSDNFARESNQFPSWLLHLLNMSESDSDSIMETEPHFYSQGDGLGIHPSISDLSTDSSSSDASVHLSNVIAVAAEPSVEPSASDNENSEDYFSVDEGNIILPDGTNEEDDLDRTDSEGLINTQDINVEFSEQSTSKKND